ASEAQGMLAAGAHQQAFHLVAPYSQFSSSGREILQAEWEFELLGHGHEQLTATCGVLGRKKRNMHIQSALPFQVNLEQVGPAGGEYPQDLPTVAGVAHLLGQHRVDATGKPAVALAAATAPGGLVSLVHEDYDLAEGMKNAEDSFQIAFGGTHPFVAEVFQLHTGNPKFSCPALNQEGLARTNPTGNEVAHG